MLLFSLVVLVGCKGNDERKLEHLTAYWEIHQVKKNKTLIKDFSISTTIDYFELTDSLQGFRKKVSPTLDGKFMVNEHQIDFKLLFENDSLNIYYQQDNIVTKETILKVNENELIIANSLGFEYLYKPFQPLNFDNE